MSDKCKYCKAVLRKELNSDPHYCSGKCRKLDGAEPLPEQVAEESKSVIVMASLADYRKNPNKYHRRFDPEKLNWGEPLTTIQLKQAGFRSNRKPIPGDWDFVKEFCHHSFFQFGNHCCYLHRHRSHIENSIFTINS